MKSEVAIFLLGVAVAIVGLILLVLFMFPPHNMYHGFGGAGALVIAYAIFAPEPYKKKNKEK